MILPMCVIVHVYFRLKVEHVLNVSVTFGTTISVRETNGSQAVLHARAFLISFRSPRAQHLDEDLQRDFGHSDISGHFSVCCSPL